MEETRKSMLTLSSNNSFQTFALTAPDEKPDWNQLAKKTTDVCKLSMNNPQWITADNRPDWLWEQSNSAITTNQTAWGWDCLGMLTLLKNNLKTK